MSNTCNICNKNGGKLIKIGRFEYVLCENCYTEMIIRAKSVNPKYFGLHWIRAYIKTKGTMIFEDRDPETIIKNHTQDI